MSAPTLSRHNRRARSSLNASDAEWAKVKAVCKRMGIPPARFIRETTMGAVEEYLEARKSGES